MDIEINKYLESSNLYSRKSVNKLRTNISMLYEFSARLYQERREAGHFLCTLRDALST